ncbi:MAG: tRNA (adenosine(37)-N6)-threonylcarbamoyltransferase complex dimerization subunit type 1 TsaB [Planctomycetota bacterium]
MPASQTFPARIALETSARPPSIAVRVGAQHSFRRLAQRRSNASDLLPVLSEVLEELGSGPLHIERIVVGTGPGSYTGLRVGIATALGLARATGAELVGVPSVEATARAGLEIDEEGVVLLDARSHQLYYAHYRRTRTGVVAVVAPTVTTPAGLADLLPDHIPILGDAAVAQAAELNESQRARLRSGYEPQASALLELGLARLERDGPMRPEEIRPLYLRPFAVRPRRR